MIRSRSLSAIIISTHLLEEATDLRRIQESRRMLELVAKPTLEQQSHGRIVGCNPVCDRDRKGTQLCQRTDRDDFGQLWW